MSMVRVGLCQTPVADDLAGNLKTAARAVALAAEQGARIVCLPEMYCCQYRSAAFKIFAERGSDDIVEKMSYWAKEYGLLLVGGSIPEIENGRMYNTCYVFDRSGKQLVKYRKMHLFDSDLPELRSHESETFGQGNSIAVFDTEFGRMGVAVCFDVRFPELIRTLSQRGAELVRIFVQPGVHPDDGQLCAGALQRQLHFVFQHFAA